ncbi:EamA family transporter [Calidifontibacter sp. DB0510]|uniref:EamA family transporter n=1 Tax=Metallococcus carri TaxID=1656884 RepID=A0A967B0B9_9MICO|nr:EamA family transporter [Metallococcus carri]NHN55732.1 EamA family transporter [Metallococcus carri]NOP38579.1 EamA family transporter [Calidifontibacter sp. DB2511S]
MEAKVLRDAAITAIAPIAWGSTYYVTRNYLPAGIPLNGAVIRALPAGLLLLAVTRQLPRGSWWWRAALISALTVGGFFVLIYVAGQRLPSSVASVLMATSAVVTLLMARALIGERATRRAYAGAAVGVLGVALLLGATKVHLDALGVGASLLAMLCASLGFVLTKRWQPPVPPVTFAAWQLTFGGLMVAPVALATEGLPPVMPTSAVVAFGYLILIATALAYWAWFHGLRALPAGTVGIVGLLNPLSGALLGVLLAGERLGSWQVVGAVLIVIGVVLGLRTRAGRASRTTPPDASPDAPAVASGATASPGQPVGKVTSCASADTPMVTTRHTDWSTEPARR